MTRHRDSNVAHVLPALIEHRNFLRAPLEHQIACRHRYRGRFQACFGIFTSPATTQPLHGTGNFANGNQVVKDDRRPIFRTLLRL
jgi:hypothetical protein